MTGNIKNRTISGVGWSAVSQFVTQGFTFAISIVLARILGPKAYGLIGMVTVFTGFANLFGGLGLGEAIVQRKDLEARHLDVAFWANLAAGTAMALLVAGLAPLVAWFYREPRLTALTTVVSIGFVLGALNIVQIALLKREMRFRALAAVQIGGGVVSGLAGLGFALSGVGVWSLVAQTLVAAAVRLLLSWRLANWRPHWSFEWRACRELFGFSGPVLAFDLITYWGRTLDQLLIGRFVGASALGIYSRSYNLMLFPLQQVSRVVGKVMFSAMSRIQDDKPRVKRVYLKAITMIGFLTFPVMIGLFVVSNHFVLALLGVRWSEIIPILKLFCWVGLIQSIVATSGWIYTSQGKTRIYLGMGVVGMVANVACFLIGIHWGIMGVAWAYTIRNLITLIPFLAVPGRLIDLSCFEIMKCLAPTFFCSMVMSVVVWGVGHVLPNGLPHWQFLAIEVPVGIASYFLLLILFKVDSWCEVRQIMFGRIEKGLKLLPVWCGRHGFSKGGGIVD